jgi:hypothetical protein
MTEPNTELVQKAVRQLLALRKLSRETGTQTTRTQNEILRSLPAAELIAVAELLNRDESNNEYGNEFNHQ